MEEHKAEIERETPMELTPKQIESNFKSKMMFPYGYNKLEHSGFTEAYILELRRLITEEIKRQNDNNNPV